VELLNDATWSYKRRHVEWKSTLKK